MGRAGIYVRISDDRAGSGLGVARQETDCKALCERHGHQVVHVWSDNDRSAYSGKRRPGYEALMAALKAGEIDVIVAWHPDRLHRSPKELEGFIDAVEAAQAQVQTVTAGEIDLSTPTGRMTARVVGAVARHESEHKADRLRRKHQELAEQGRPAGGNRRMFGWLDDRKSLHPQEATLIREAAQRILDGGTLRAIVVDWEARGVRTARGGTAWGSSVISRLLTSARVAGYREYGGKLYRAQWEPILDDLTWRRVRAVLLDPSRRAARAPRRYLLTGGLAVCGLCGAGLVARPKGDGRRAYVCASPPMFHGCGKIAILAADFEADILARVRAVLDAGHMPTPEPTGVDELVDEIEQLEGRLAELADDYYVHRAVTRAQFQSASSGLRDRMESLRAEVGRRERTRVAPVDQSVLDGWDDLPVESRRAVVAAVVDQVVVGPALRGRNFYSPDRVQVRWRA